MTRERRVTRWCLVAFALAIPVLAGSPAQPAAGQDGPPARRPKPAPIPDDAPPLPVNGTDCNYQTPLPDMVRENFLPRWTQPPEEQQRRQGMQREAVRFRTENYGYFEGFGEAGWNDKKPTDLAERTEFMGLPVRLNTKVLPALACVEQVIGTECADDEYTPVRLSGIRTRNTYHNNQVSNHVYGIAIDVDPHLNTCCMCVAEWGDHRLCQSEVESIYERMAMPSCWVHVFERFGFYWLGRDRLQDTMHFEFLGDPDHVLKSEGRPPHMPEPEPDPEPEPEPEPEVAEAPAEVTPEVPSSEAPPPQNGCGCRAAGH